MRQGATLVLGLFLAAACGSRTDLWDVAGSGNNPGGGGGKGGASGSGFVGGTGGNGVGVGGATGKGGSGTGGATTGTGGSGTGGATTGSGGSGTGGIGGSGTGGIGGSTTGSGGATTGSGGSTGGTGGGGAGGTGGSGTGGTGGSGTGGATTGTGGTGGTTGGTGGTGTGGTGTGGTGGTGGAPPDGGSTCFNIIQANDVPIDLHLLLDRSPAMNVVDVPSMSRWERTYLAIDKTLKQTGLNIRYAASFYPLLSDASPDPACWPGEHVNPAVEYTRPRVNPIPEIMRMQLLTGSPTAWPALQGATDHAAGWFAQPKTGQNPRDEATVAPSVVLFAASQPLDCGSTVLAMATTARTAFTSPFHIRTFVVAIGSDASGFEPLVVAGGTSRVLYSPPLTVDEAIARVERSRAVCDIPFNGATDSLMPRLEVRSRLENGKPLTVLTRRAALADCANGGGWFLADPKLIMLCPDTCAEIIDAPAGQVAAGFTCDPDAGTPLSP